MALISSTGLERLKVFFYFVREDIHKKSDFLVVGR